MPNSRVSDSSFALTDGTSAQAYVWSVTKKCAQVRGDYGQALALARTGLAWGDRAPQLPCAWNLPRPRHAASGLPPPPGGTLPVVASMRTG